MQRHNTNLVTSLQFIIVYISSHHPKLLSFRNLCTANPIWGDIVECKAQSSKLERLFSLKRGKRDVRALSFEPSEMTPQVGLAVYCRMHIYTYTYVYAVTCIYTHMFIYTHVYTHTHIHIYSANPQDLLPR